MILCAVVLPAVFATASDPFGYIIAAVLSGGLLSAYTAYRKAGPEVESIGVSTLRGVIEELREEILRKEKQIDALTRQAGEQSAQIAELRDKCQVLLDRVVALEQPTP